MTKELKQKLEAHAESLLLESGNHNDKAAFIAGAEWLYDEQGYQFTEGDVKDIVRAVTRSVRKLSLAKYRELIKVWRQK